MAESNSTGIGEKKFNTKIQKITHLYDLSSELVEAVNLIKSNEVVAFPTETVYGLGANALDEKAVKKIFQAKGRPSDNPIIVHISSYEMFTEVTSLKSNLEIIKKLQKCFWPGPLTLIVPKSDKVPYITTGGLETIAVRMPINPIALALISQSKTPIAAPSANISGKPSPTTAIDVYEDMQGKIALILDGGNSEIGLESTVLDVSDIKRNPTILRPGKVTRREIEECLGMQVDIFDITLLSDGRKELQAKSPGLKYRHYAPKAEVILVNDIDTFIKEYSILKTKFANIGLIFDEKYISPLQSRDVSFKGEVIYSYASLEEFASNLYFKLREMDKKNVPIIIILFNESQGLAEAIKNRLVKASSKK